MNSTGTNTRESTSINQRSDSLKDLSNLPKLNEPKIIFVNSYFKNRSLSKSLKINLPYIKKEESPAVADLNLNEEKIERIKPILKTRTSFRNNNNLITLSIMNNKILFNEDLNIRKTQMRRTVRFADEVESDETNEKDLNSSFNVKHHKKFSISKLCLIESQNKENTEKFIFEKLKNIKCEKEKSEINKNKGIIHEKDDSISESDSSFFSDNNEKMNINSNSEEAKNNNNKEEKIESKKNNSKNNPKKNLAEIITVPSFRNLDIYRYQKIDLKEKNSNNNKEKDKETCNGKCCIVF